MERADVVVVGGSAAGIPAALTAKKHYPDKSVLLVRREEQVPIPCGIPYIFGTLGATEKNLIPDAILAKNDCKLLRAEVVDVDRTDRYLITSNKERIGYEKLILATGSRPIRPKIPGVEKENIFLIKKDVPYLRELLKALPNLRNLVIVGGGFIGVEFADECKKNPGLNVTIVEWLPHCLALAYDDEACESAEALLRERGVELRTGVKVEAFTGGAKVEGVRLSDGATLEADAVILAIGATAETAAAQACGLTLGPTGGVEVDETMRAGDEHIFACGDCAEKVSFFTRKPSPLKLASIATMEARIAGANLYGVRRRNPGALGVFSTVVGSTAFAAAGLTEREAKANGYDTVIGTAEGPNRHPGTMPGAAPRRVKLIFDRKSGLLLGGQVVGPESCGGMVNIIAACIQGKKTADEIVTLQLGTHPAVTASPIAYPLVNAAEAATYGIQGGRP